MSKNKQGAKTPCSFSLNNFQLYEMPLKNHVAAIHELPLQTIEPKEQTFLSAKTYFFKKGCGT